MVGGLIVGVDNIMLRVFHDSCIVGMLALDIVIVQ
jgi:hypothetical protein